MPKCGIFKVKVYADKKIDTLQLINDRNYG